MGTSLFCSPKTITTLLIGRTPIQNKKLKEKNIAQKSSSAYLGGVLKKKSSPSTKSLCQKRSWLWFSGQGISTAHIRVCEQQGCSHVTVNSPAGKMKPLLGSSSDWHSLVITGDITCGWGISDFGSSDAQSTCLIRTWKTHRQWQRSEAEWLMNNHGGVLKGHSGPVWKH